MLYRVSKQAVVIMSGWEMAYTYDAFPEAPRESFAKVPPQTAETEVKAKQKKQQQTTYPT